ncbi:ATP-binding protein [Streptomyces sp. JL4002]|uniref:ATP-binding protein n=1 Tax=unclassified Streptomyces TaxID=2593676 RepID=UPI0036698901
MKLVGMAVRNFRGFNDEVSVSLADFTALAGMNSSGKSTLLEALDIYFSGRAPDKDDLCKGAEDQDIEIECTFSDTGSELVIDAQATTTLAQEYLLDDAGYLVVRKSYNCRLATPKESKATILCRHPSAEGYEDLLSLKNAELKSRAISLGVDLSGVNKSSNVEIRQAIWTHCDDLLIDERDLVITKEDDKKIWDSIRKELPHYALFRADRASTDQDSEAQDPIKSAVANAIRQHETALNDIASAIHGALQPVLDETVRGMAEINPELASSLAPRSTRPKWESVFKISLTDDEAVPVNKWGSGSRRLLLMNFFRAQASTDQHDRNGPTIYAIEEPETALHPTMQRQLLSSLLTLSKLEGSQVFVTTHSPTLARMIPIQSLRRIKRSDGKVSVLNPDPFAVEELARDLGVLPDHDVKLFIGVEGVHDIQFLTGVATSLHKAGFIDLDLDDLVSDGSAVFIPLGGDNLGHWVSRWKDLGVPEFYLFDRDNTADEPDQIAHQKQLEELNKRRNVIATHTHFREIENYFPTDVIEGIFPGISFTPKSRATSDFAKEISEILKATSGVTPLRPANVKARLCAHADRITAKHLMDMGVLDEAVGWFKTMEGLLNQK